MNQIRFSCTSLLGTNKAGNLPKDENGYYTMVVGALNMFNSAGQYYVYDQAKQLFEGSSQLMRRVKRGALRGEYGHPKREVGQREDSFAARVLSIWEEKCCCHHKEIWLDFDNVKDANGNPIIAIMSKVYPSGPYGDVLQKSIDNNGENVCFSIRSFTDDYIEGGIVKRALKTIVTFDYVNEPGMAVAEKYKSPALEAYKDEEFVFTRSQMVRAVKNNTATLGMESAAMTAEELFTTLGWQTDSRVINQINNAPRWSNW